MNFTLDSFRVRLAILFGGLSFVVGLLMMAYVYQTTSNRLTAASGASLSGVGKAISNVIATTLMEREREISLLSQRLIFVDSNLPAIREAVDLVQRSYRHYAWIGYADTTGTVRAAGGGLLEGVSVATRPWFTQGLNGTFVGDVHEAVLLAKKLQKPDAIEPLRFVDFAAPVRDRKGDLIGVVATHANWAWAGEVLASALPPDAARQGIEAFIIGRDGSVLYPYASMGTVRIPANLPPDGNHAILQWQNAGEFLTSHIRIKASTTTDLGWQIVVRQPVAKALAGVDELQRNLLWLGGIATLIFVLLAYRLAGELSRPIEALAGIANGIRAGNQRTQFEVRSRSREIRSLSASLQGMTDTLLAHEQALSEANATLEQKVHERTAALETANRELERLSRHDSLTGLHNRLAATQALRAEFLRMKRSLQCYAVLMLDIDHFKRVNDTHGHEAGDMALKQVAAILDSSIRSTDFVARFGGEEFLVILPDTLEGALTIAEKIRATVAAASIPTVGHVTVSLGIAIADSADADEDVAVRAADAALYRAKHAGRNRVICATGDTAQPADQPSSSLPS